MLALYSHLRATLHAASRTTHRALSLRFLMSHTTAGMISRRDFLFMRVRDFAGGRGCRGRIYREFAHRHEGRLRLLDLHYRGIDGEALPPPI